MRCLFATLAFFALILASFAPGASAAGSLTGTSTVLTTAQASNLTSQGTADWAHWGTTTAASFDHKAGVTAAISNYTLVGTGTVLRYANNLTGYTWNDGTPTAGATNSTTGLYVSGTGNGFRVTVPADTTARTLTVYVGGYNSEATLTAHLSDGSAADFTDSSYGFDKPGNYNGHNFLPVYTLTYKAATAGQTLSVSWVQTAGTGNVTLQSAALTLPAPAAPTGLVATPISPTQINLTWTAPAGTVTGYNIKRGTTTGGPYTTIGTSTVASYSNTGLSAATRYYYVVTALNGGSEGAASAEVLRTTLCVAPTNLTATAIGAQIGLSWTASAGAASYSLYRGTAAGGEAAYKTGLVGTSYTDTVVTAGTAYYYTLRAVNNGGTSAASNEASATVPTAAVPLYLSNLSVSPTTVTGGGSVMITVTLSSPAPTGGATVALHSDNSAVVVPANVVIAGGATSKTFSVTTTSVSAGTNVTLSGSYNGWTQGDGVELLPTSLPGLSFTMPPVSVTPGNGCAILSWNRLPKEILNGYNVYRLNAGTKTRLTATPFESNFYPVTGLTNDTATYTYQVAAVDILGQEHALSTPVTITPSSATGTLNWVNPPSAVTDRLIMDVALPSGGQVFGTLFFIDGQQFGGGGGETLNVNGVQTHTAGAGFDSTKLSNGPHTVQFVGFVDVDQTVACVTPPITIQVSNTISNSHIDNSWFAPAQKELCFISAAAPAGSTWTVQATSADGTTIFRTWQGASSLVKLAWDGKDASGNALPITDYALHLTVQPPGTSPQAVAPPGTKSVPLAPNAAGAATKNHPVKMLQGQPIGLALISVGASYTKDSNGHPVPTPAQDIKLATVLTNAYTTLFGAGNFQVIRSDTLFRG